MQTGSPRQDMLLARKWVPLQAMQRMPEPMPETGAGQGLLSAHDNSFSSTAWAGATHMSAVVAA